MSTLITSANPLGLRALGSGGRTAVASYEQITRTLRQSLGPDHAALFAEPSPRAASIDWFTEADRGDAVVRLTEAEPTLRQRGLDRLDGLVRDVEAKAVSLRKSDRQDERILGDMLTQALDIPSEDAVFMVGERPVMTFWGHVRDIGQPSVKPLHSLLLRRGVPAPETPRPPAPTPIPVGGSTVEPDPAVSDLIREPVEARRRRRVALAPALLWIVLTLLLLTCGIELLRGCALGLPHALTGWFINYCPAGQTGGSADAIAAERARQAQLQAEYDEAVRQAALKRQACEIKSGKDGPATPVPPTPPREQLKIPPKASALDFLEGCWRAHEGLTETVDGKDTGKKLKVNYCFNKDGSGSRIVRYEEDGAQCRGVIRARLDGEKLIITIDRAPCEGNHGNYSAALDTCRRGDDGAANCDEVSEPDGTPNFNNFPFTRSTEQP